MMNNKNKVPKHMYNIGRSAIIKGFIDVVKIRLAQEVPGTELAVVYGTPNETMVKYIEAAAPSHMVKELLRKMLPQNFSYKVPAKSDPSNWLNDDVNEGFGGRIGPGTGRYNWTKNRTVVKKVEPLTERNIYVVVRDSRRYSVGMKASEAAKACYVLCSTHSKNRTAGSDLYKSAVVLDGGNFSQFNRLYSKAESLGIKPVMVTDDKTHKSAFAFGPVSSTDAYKLTSGLSLL